MSLYETLQNDLKTAMKAGDSLSLGVLRFALSAINLKKKEKEIQEPGVALSDAEVTDLLQKDVKRRRESISLYKQGDRPDLVTEEEQQLAVITRYLPTELTEDEVVSLIATAITEAGSREFPAVVKLVMPKIAGRFDGKRVAELIRQQL